MVKEAFPASNSIRLSVTPDRAGPLTSFTKVSGLTPVNPIPDIEDWAGVIFYDKFLGTVAAGAIDNTPTTDNNAERKVSDSSDLLTINNGLIFAASSLSPQVIEFVRSAGAPPILRVGMAFAVVFTRSAVDADNPLIGFDSSILSANPFPNVNFSAVGSGSLEVRPNEASTPGVRPWTVSGEQALMLVARTPAQPGDQTMFMVLKHVTGRTWQMIDNRRTGSSAAVYLPTIMSVGPDDTPTPAQVTVRKAVGLELLADNVMAEDFGRLTTYLEFPASSSTFNHRPNCQLRFQFTRVNQAAVDFEFRRDSPNDNIRVSATTDGSFQVWKKVGGVSGLLASVADVFVDDEFYEVDIIAEDNSVKVFVNGVSRANLSITELTTNTGGQIIHNVFPNDVVIRGSAYPALGGNVIKATARVVRPQNSQQGTHDQDCFIAIRDIKLPSPAADVIRLRVFGGSELNLEIYPDGAVRFLQDTTQLLSMGSGTVTDGESLIVMLSGAGAGATAKFYVESNEVGTYTAPTAATMLAGTGYFFQIANGFTCGAVEFWPLTFDLPFTLG